MVSTVAAMARGEGISCSGMAAAQERTSLENVPWRHSRATYLRSGHLAAADGAVLILDNRADWVKIEFFMVKIPCSRHMVVQAPIHTGAGIHENPVSILISV